MTENQKLTGNSIPLGLAVGCITGLAITVGGSAICARLIAKEIIREDAESYCVIALILVSSMLGAMTAAAKIKRKRVYVCALTGAAYYGILLATTARFFDGSFRGMGVTALLVLAGCGCAALAGLKKDRPAYQKKKRRRR